MLVQVHHDPPGPWSTYIAGKPAWLLPYLLIEYPLAWAACGLSRWSLLHVLESLGSLSVLVAVVFYFSESGDRIKQKHYQAWQVINTAQHMSGSGGRIDALAELNADDVPLVGVDVSSSFLQGVSLPKARLLRANFTDADVRNSDLGADLGNADLSGIQWQQIKSIRRANLAGVKNAPSGFVSWALKNGAVQLTSNPNCPVTNTNP